MNSSLRTPECQKSCHNKKCRRCGPSALTPKTLHPKQSAGVVAPSLMLGGIFGRCVAAAIPPSFSIASPAFGALWLRLRACGGLGFRFTAYLNPQQYVEEWPFCGCCWAFDRVQGGLCSRRSVNSCWVSCRDLNVWMLDMYMCVYIQTYIHMYR